MTCSDRHREPRPLDVPLARDARGERRERLRQPVAVLVEVVAPDLDRTRPDRGVAVIAVLAGEEPVLVRVDPLAGTTPPPPPPPPGWVVTWTAVWSNRISRTVGGCDRDGVGRGTVGVETSVRRRSCRRRTRADRRAARTVNRARTSLSHRHRAAGDATCKGRRATSKAATWATWRSSGAAGGTRSRRSRCLRRRWRGSGSRSDPGSSRRPRHHRSCRQAAADAGRRPGSRQIATASPHDRWRHVGVHWSRQVTRWSAAGRSSHERRERPPCVRFPLVETVTALLAASRATDGNETLSAMSDTLSIPPSMPPLAVRNRTRAGSSESRSSSHARPDQLRRPASRRRRPSTEIDRRSERPPAG